MRETSTLSIEIPADLAAELTGLDQECLADILRRGLRERRIDEALARYEQGGVSFAAAAEIARISHSDLARVAYSRNLEPPFDECMLSEEIG